MRVSIDFVDDLRCVLRGFFWFALLVKAVHLRLAFTQLKSSCTKVIFDIWQRLIITIAILFSLFDYQTPSIQTKSHFALCSLNTTFVFIFLFFTIIVITVGRVSLPFLFVDCFTRNAHCFAFLIRFRLIHHTRTHLFSWIVLETDFFKFFCSFLYTFSSSSLPSPMCKCI